MRPFLRAIDFGCLLAFLLGWAALVEPRVVDVERVLAPIPGLPPGWEGVHVGFLSELQVGMANSNERLPPWWDRCSMALHRSSSCTTPERCAASPPTPRQSRCPATPWWTAPGAAAGVSLLDVVAPELPVEGWARDYGGSGNRLYVSRAVGVSILGLRFACPRVHDPHALGRLIDDRDRNGGGLGSLARDTGQDDGTGRRGEEDDYRIGTFKDRGEKAGPQRGGEQEREQRHQSTPVGPELNLSS